MLIRELQGIKERSNTRTSLEEKLNVIVTIVSHTRSEKKGIRREWVGGWEGGGGRLIGGYDSLKQFHRRGTIIRGEGDLSKDGYCSRKHGNYGFAYYTAQGDSNFKSVNDIPFRSKGLNRH